MPSLRYNFQVWGNSLGRLLSHLIPTASLGVSQSYLHFDNLLEESKNSLKAIILTVIVYYRERTHYSKSVKVRIYIRAYDSRQGPGEARCRLLLSSHWKGQARCLVDQEPLTYAQNTSEPEILK